MLGGLRSLAIVGLAAAALPLVGSLPLDHDLSHSFDRHVRTISDNVNGEMLQARQDSPDETGGGGEPSGGHETQPTLEEAPAPEATLDAPPAPEPTAEDGPAPVPTMDAPQAPEPTGEEAPAPETTLDEAEAPKPTTEERVEDEPKKDTSKDADSFYLRIMPLGASITEGKPDAPGSKDGNGYRKYLRDHLRNKGWQVNMVGSRQHGSMKDNDHEGKYGDTISQVEARAQKSVRGWLPNLVLINAGTNDAREGKLEGAGVRMRSLIDTAFSGSPQTVVIVSTLLPSDHQDEVDELNGVIRNLTREYIYDAEGKVIEKPQRRLLLADMVPFIKSDDIHDGIHPTVDGFKKMASVWADAIDRAHDRGWLQKESASSQMPDKDADTCRKPFGSGEAVDPRGGTQILWAASEVIADDGPYRHESIEHKNFLDTKFWPKSSQFDRLYFANLVRSNPLPGEEMDDMIMVRPSTDSMRFRVNKGKGEFTDWIDLKVTSFCRNRNDGNAAGIRWADVNGDGLDDFVCISPEGEMYVAINKGGADEGKQPTFGETFKFRSSLRGRSQLYVHLADIDGDGRVDFCVMEDIGDVYCERNGGTGDGAEYWQDMSGGEPVFIGKDKGDFRGLRFVDLNGDGRSDWMWMDRQGRVETYFNYPGDGKGMMPRWVNAGVTHQGLPKDMIASWPGLDNDIGVTRKHVVFGRIFGTGRNDYVKWEAKTGESPLYVHVWENVSKGGRLQKGDGVYFGDFTKTGFDDYAFISSDGQVHVFRNTVNKKDFDNYNDKTWDGPYDALKTGLSRRALHVADWNGDGYADVIGVTDRRSGAIAVWETKWDGKEFSWNRKDIGGTDKCKHGWGKQPSDHAAHFADIDGDGRADYLCMDTAGTVTALLNTKDGLNDVGQVKYSEKLDRANFRFADANGDGKADLIWVDKFNGDGKVWYNQGLQKDREGLDGSLFLWDKPVGVSYQGSHRGPNMRFPNLGGHGRADMVGVEGTSAKAWLWYNSCGVSGDDKPDSGDDRGDKDVGEDDPNLSSPLPEYEGSDPEDLDPKELTTPSVDEKGKNVFCDTNSEAWTQELWNKHDVGNWGIQRSLFYSHIDNKWPDSVPRSFARYNYQERDGLWNWNGACLAVNLDCDITEDHLKNVNECPREYKRAMWLWAARNYAKYFQALWKLSDMTINAVARSANDLVDKFKHKEASDAISPHLSMGMALATFVGLVPGLAPSTTAFSAGIIAANSLIAQLGPEPEDSQYRGFAGLMNLLSGDSNYMMDALSHQFDQMFKNPPPNNDREAGTALAEILKDGRWMLTDEIAGKYDIKDLRTALTASLINNLWQSQRMAIIRWSDDQFRGLQTHKEPVDWSPCNGVKGHPEWAHVEACIDEDKGTNYAFAAFVGETGKNLWSPRGITPDVLKEYDLTQADVIMSSLNRQRLSNRWLDNSLDFWNGLGKLSKDEVPKGKRLHLDFNIPICDLTGIDKSEFKAPESTCQKWECVSIIIAQHCGKLKLGRHPFPYKWDWKVVHHPNGFDGRISI